MDNPLYKEVVHSLINNRTQALELAKVEVDKVKVKGESKCLQDKWRKEEEDRSVGGLETSHVRGEGGQIADITTVAFQCKIHWWLG